MLHAEDIAALMGARHPDPCAVLGMQERDGQIWVHALLPGALGVDLLDRTSGRCVAGLQRLAGSEVFGVRLARRRLRFDYLLRVQWPGPSDQAHPAPVLLEDPYRFGIVLGELDLWLLAEGTHRRPHQCLGALPRVLQSVAGVSFAVWAPNAQRVSVVGPFNGWDGRRHPMRLRRESGIWELFVLLSFASTAQAIRRLEIAPLQDGVDLRSRLAAFNVADAQCYDPNEQRTLRAVIDASGGGEAGSGIEAFNAKIHQLAELMN